MGGTGKLWLGILLGTAAVYAAVYAVVKVAGPRAGLGQLVDAKPEQVRAPQRELTKTQFRARAHARSYDLEVE